MLKIASVAMFLVVPFLSLWDGIELFCYRCGEGWSLARAMWNEQ